MQKCCKIQLKILQHLSILYDFLQFLSFPSLSHLLKNYIFLKSHDPVRLGMNKKIAFSMSFLFNSVQHLAFSSSPHKPAQHHSCISILPAFVLYIRFFHKNSLQEARNPSKHIRVVKQFYSPASA